jgi:hypothetical protein
MQEWCFDMLCVSCSISQLVQAAWLQQQSRAATGLLSAVQHNGTLLLMLYGTMSSCSARERV